MQRIDELVSQCTQDIASADTAEAQSLRKHLVTAAGGIRMLRDTYGADATTQASLDRVLDKLEQAVSGNGKEEILQEQSENI